jgi:hypothetical protein
LATEFPSAVGPGQVDYSSWQSWEAATQADLTDAQTRVYSIARTGALADAAAVSGNVNSYSATVKHCTTTQIMVAHLNAAEVYEEGEQIQVDGSNYATVAAGNSGGDTVILVAEVDASPAASPVGGGSMAGGTSGAANYVETRPASGRETTGKYSAALPHIEHVAAEGVFQVALAHTRWLGLQLKSTRTASAAPGFNFVKTATDSEQIVDSCLVYGALGTGIQCVNDANYYLYNNTVYDTNLGIDCRVPYTAVVYQNTIVAYSAAAMRVGQGNTGVVKNNVVFPGPTSCATDHSIMSIHADSTNNAYVNDSTGSAPIDISAEAATDLFSNYSAKDYRIKLGSALIAAGSALNPDPDGWLNVADDIQGDPRSASAPDVGSDEFSTSTYNGTVDEVQVLDAVSTAAATKADYDAQRDALLSAGGVETAGDDYIEWENVFEVWSSPHTALQSATWPGTDWQYMGQYDAKCQASVVLLTWPHNQTASPVSLTGASMLWVLTKDNWKFGTWTLASQRFTLRVDNA